MENIAQVVREKAARLAEIENEAARLRMELDDIREAAGDVRAAPLKRKVKAGKGRRHGRSPSSGSNVAAAAAVLTGAGRPMHIDMLLADVERIVGKPITKAGLVGQLSEYVRKGNTFTRPRPSTFGLMVWENGKITNLPVNREAATEKAM